MGSQVKIFPLPANFPPPTWQLSVGRSSIPENDAPCHFINKLEVKRYIVKKRIKKCRMKNMRTGDLSACLFWNNWITSQGLSSVKNLRICRATFYVHTKSLCEFTGLFSKIAKLSTYQFYHMQLFTSLAKANNPPSNTTNWQTLTNAYDTDSFTDDHMFPWACSHLALRSRDAAKRR